MAIVAEPYFRVPSKDGAQLSFSSADELFAWADQQYLQWQPILGIDANKYSKPLRIFFDRARGLVAAIFARIGELKVTQTAENLNALRIAFEKAQSDAGISFPNQIVEFFTQLSSQRGEMAAVAALAGLGPAPAPGTPHFDLFNPDIRSGVLAGWLFQQGLDPTSLAAANQKLGVLIAAHEKTLADLSARTKRFDSEARSTLEAVAADAAKQRAEGEAAHNEAQQLFAAQQAKAIESFQGAETTFREQMHLQAPAEYWTRRAVLHRKSEATIRNWLLGYGIVGGGVTVSLLLLLAYLGANAVSAGDVAGWVKYAVLGILIVTLAFWIAKILLRFLISERHLAIDAEERVTMVTTYLALTKDANLQDADRPLVLAPLFRSASDGIVKDDGAPDTLLTAIVGRLLDKWK